MVYETNCEMNDEMIHSGKIRENHRPRAQSIAPVRVEPMPFAGEQWRIGIRPTLEKRLILFLA